MSPFHSRSGIITSSYPATVDLLPPKNSWLSHLLLLASVLLCVAFPTSPRASALLPESPAHHNLCHHHHQNANPYYAHNNLGEAGERNVTNFYSINRQSKRPRPKRPSRGNISPRISCRSGGSSYWINIPSYEIRVVSHWLLAI